MESDYMPDAVSQRTNVCEQKYCGISFADKRPITTIQKKVVDAIHLGTPKCIIQKMAVMACDNMNEESNALVWNNLEYAKSEAPGAVGDCGANKVWKFLNDNEQIRLVHHGNRQGLINGHDAGYIFNSMFHVEGESIPSGRKIGKVIFQSCFAGVDGGVAQGLSSLLQQIPEQKDVQVEGRTEVAFGFRGMGENTGEENKYDTVLNEILSKPAINKTKSGRPVLLPRGKYCFPWDIVGVSKEVWDGYSPDVKMEEIASEMAPYWETVKTMMEQRGAFNSRRYNTFPQEFIDLERKQQNPSRCF